MRATVLNLIDDQYNETGERTLCKFVLVRLEEKIHMVFGRMAEYPYHASLVEHFCSLNAIASGWEHKPDLYEILEGDCEILGGGYLDISPSTRRVAIYGSSTAYGAFPVPELSLVVESEPFFDGYAVTVQ